MNYIPGAWQRLAFRLLKKAGKVCPFQKLQWFVALCHGGSGPPRAKEGVRHEARVPGDGLYKQGEALPVTEVTVVLERG